MSVRQADCLNCGWPLIENPKAGEWLHRSTAERPCHSLVPGFRANPKPWTIKPLSATDEGMYLVPGSRLRELSERASEMNDLRDTVDPYVAEALYEETIAWNVDVRGGTASTSEWPPWEDLPDMAREHWISMAVTARVAAGAALAVARRTEEER